MFGKSRNNQIRKESKLKQKILAVIDEIEELKRLYPDDKTKYNQLVEKLNDLMYQLG